MGEIDFIKAEIKLLSDMAPHMKQKILLHEILHGIFDALGHSEHEERLIQSLASALHSVLRENKFFQMEVKE